MLKARKSRTSTKGRANMCCIKLFSIYKYMSYAVQGRNAPLALACPPLDMLRSLFSQFKPFIKALMTESMLNYVCAKTVPDSTKLRLIKGPKSKFPCYVPNPLVCHMLCTRICTCPPNNPNHLILPLVGQKAERNPALAKM